MPRERFLLNIGEDNMVIQEQNSDAKDIGEYLLSLAPGLSVRWHTGIQYKNVYTVLP